MLSQPKVILCADDDPDDRELMCETATKIDPTVQIVTADNGKDALQKLKELESANMLPCLIILDMNMPIMGGEETLKEIRNHKEWDNIPIAIFTTSPKNFYTHLEEKYGINIVTKPAQYDVIVKEVTQLLSYCRAA